MKRESINTRLGRWLAHMHGFTGRPSADSGAVMPKSSANQLKDEVVQAAEDYIRARTACNFRALFRAVYTYRYGSEA